MAGQDEVLPATQFRDVSIFTIIYNTKLGRQFYCKGNLFILIRDFNVKIKKYLVSEIEFCEVKAVLATSETRAKKFEAESIKLQKENIELTLELENSRKPGQTNQEGLKK